MEFLWSEEFWMEAIISAGITAGVSLIGIIATIITAFLAYRSKLEKMLNSLHQEHEALSHGHTDRTNEHSGLSKEHTGLSKEHSGLSEEHKELKDEIRQSTASVKEATSGVLQQAKENAVGITKVADHLLLQQGRFEGLSDKAQAITSALCTLQSAAKTITDMETSNAALQKELAQAQKSIRSFRAHLLHLQSENNGLKEELAAARQEIQQLNRHISHLENPEPPCRPKPPTMEF